MKRIYTEYFQEYLNKKIVLITGPRQSGKTTVTGLFKGAREYLNFDNEEHRTIYKDKSWDRKNDFIVFDELHKKPKWKQWLKGIYDTEKIPPGLVVTGSARLDTFKKMGDSLAGRYFHYRLYPLDLREIVKINPRIDREEVLEKLLNFSGFPEPYLEANDKFYHLWKRTHLDIILKQDLIFQEDVRHLKSIELLIDILKTKIGSPISYSSLAQELQCSDKTVKRWLTILENMYVIFKIIPYSKNIARSSLKQPKYYFYDNARVVGDAGVKLENLVACSLLKECHFRQDCLGEDWELFYLRKKGGIEVDFLISNKQTPKIMIEVKTSDDKPTKNFSIFFKELKNIQQVQIVKNLVREKTYPSGVEVRKVSNWLVDW